MDDQHTRDPLLNRTKTLTNPSRPVPVIRLGSRTAGENERANLVSSDAEEVLVRGRETRPTVPVRRDSAEAIREREDVLETKAVGEDRCSGQRPNSTEFDTVQLGSREVRSRAGIKARTSGNGSPNTNTALPIP